MADSELAIRAEGLTKLYGSDRGVLELDFSVAAGEVFGFLGPNEARSLHRRHREPGPEPF